jgi:hypothetical protein
LKEYEKYEKDRIENQMIVGTFGISTKAFPFLELLCEKKDIKMHRQENVEVKRRMTRGRDDFTVVRNVELKVVQPLRQLTRLLHDPHQLHLDDGNAYLAGVIKKIMQPTFNMFTTMPAEGETSTTESREPHSSAEQNVPSSASEPSTRIKRTLVNFDAGKTPLVYEELSISDTDLLQCIRGRPLVGKAYQEVKDEVARICCVVNGFCCCLSRPYCCNKPFICKPLQIWGACRWS